MIEFKVGIADFNRQLNALSLEFRTKSVRAGVRAAGIVFRNAARLNAPVLASPIRGKSPRTPGALKRNIYVGIPRKQTPGAVRAIVSVRSGRKNQKNGDPFYWRFLEGGWVPRGPGNRLAGGVRTRALARARTASRKISFPFMRPAFNSTQPQAIAGFEKQIGETIKKHSAK